MLIGAFWRLSLRLCWRASSMPFPKVGEVVRIAGLGVAVEWLGRGMRPGVQLTSRGIRPRARRSTDWYGQALGRCSMTRVFRVATWAAIFSRRKRSVSNWAVRQKDRLGIRLR